MGACEQICLIGSMKCKVINYLYLYFLCFGVIFWAQNINEKQLAKIYKQNMPETSIFHTVKAQPQRHSSSKKKGIKVSLTPSKNSKSSQFDILETEVHKIAELPIVGYGSSNAKSFNEQNSQRIKLNFTYQSPAKNEVQGKIASSHTQSPIIIQFMRIYEQKHNDKTISPTLLSSVQLKADSSTKENYVSGRDIRPQVFDIVEQIASKAYRIDRNQFQDKISPKDAFSNQFQQKNQSKHLEIQTRQQNRMIEPQQSSQKMFLAKHILQTLEFLEKVHQKEMAVNNILESRIVENRNLEHQMKYQQGKRYQRFRKAEQKLCEIIKICDNKL